jgi:CHAT domain-containing protein/tetratricopeptide (TPR) repeat protein
MIRAATISVFFLGFLASGATPDDTDPLEPIRALVTAGDYAAAEEQARARVTASDDSPGLDPVAAARALDLLAEALWRGGKAHEDEALASARRALDLKTAHLGPDHVEVAESLNNVAVIHFFRGEYGAAREPWQRALAIRERTLGPDHPDVAKSLNSLANLYQTVCDYDAARPLYERALGIREAALGSDHPLVAQTLNNLGNLLTDLGDWAGARAALERALAIREKTLGTDHPQVGSSAHALANLLWRSGDRERARPLFERALAVHEAALGSDHPNVAGSRNNLGYLLMRAGSYDDALPVLEEAAAGLESALGADHPETASAWTNLGELRAAMGAEDSGLELLRRAAVVREAALGPDHPELAESLHVLARVLASRNQKDDARASFERAIHIRESALGADHPLVAQSLVGLAHLRATEADPAPALDLALRAESIAREHLRLTGRTLSEQEAIRYAAVRDRGLDLALSLVERLAPEARGRVLDALVRSRAVVLDEMAARHRTVWAAGDPAIERLAASLDSARSRLAYLTVRGLGEQEPQAYKAMLDEARDEKERAERELAEASVSFAREQARGRIGLGEVRSALPAGAALVAFVHHERFPVAPATAGAASGPPEPAGPSYTALVLRPRAKDPVAVALGPAATIDALVARWKREAASGALAAASPADAERAYRTAGDAIRRAVWDPVAGHVAGASTVFLVPDGALSLVTFASFPVGESAYLIESGPLVHYLSAERDLVVAPAGDDPRNRGLLAIGGPAFDSESGSGPLADPTTATRSSCGSFDTLRFEPLAAAAAEAETIAELWARFAGDDGASEGEVVRLTGEDASETAFKRQAVGRRVLHLATHGFFLGGECAARGIGRGFGIVNEPEAAPLPEGLSPLLLSGVALAGANARRTSGTTRDDGILTGEELAALDLSGVEWAVLSACDTGVGEVQPGEGVLGLRRAMQIAGVRTLIMSLWPVDDEATRQCMELLYDARLARGAGTAEAVRAAGRELLERRRAAEAGTHPFYWAAFVAAGAWD